MNAFPLVRDLLQAGFALSVEAGRLIVTPASKLSHELRYLVRTHKDDLVALLSVRSALWRIRVPGFEVDVIRGESFGALDILTDHPEALTAVPIHLPAREKAA